MVDDLNDLGKNDKQADQKTNYNTLDNQKTIVSNCCIAHNVFSFVVVLLLFHIPLYSENRS